MTLTKNNNISLKNIEYINNYGSTVFYFFSDLVPHFISKNIPDIFSNYDVDSFVINNNILPSNCFLDSEAGSFEIHSNNKDDIKKFISNLNLFLKP
jgi:hypothetical protein